MQETMVQLLGLEEQEGQATHSSVLGLPWRSAGKDAACHAGDLASVPGLGRFPGKAMVPHSSILAWRIPWGGKELDMTEQFSLSISFTLSVQFSSVQCSRSVVSDSLRPHESQHAMPPCPSPTPKVYSDSCPTSR